MRVFLEANIIVSVVNKEYPLFTYTARILSLADINRFELYTSPICLAIAFYFAEKKHKTKVARQKITLLAKNIRIADAGASTVKKALENPAVKDFEDGLEYYSAKENKCTCIITEDTRDFYFSKIEVLNSHDFYLKYMAKVN